jgi:3-hydroxyisobutyrate dehydrogenase-like beta-hydroxyacid dehydrogenase
MISKRIISIKSKSRKFCYFCKKVEMSLKVAILGAGNVGMHLANIFTRAGHKVEIWSRTADNAKSAAANAGCLHIAHPSAMASDTDICIAALSEDALTDVCQKLPTHFNGILAHTAGSVDIDFL